MVPRRTPATERPVPAPRTRGDGPSTARAPAVRSSCSPRPRGWSLDSAGTGRPVQLLPAPAGMVPGQLLGHRPGQPAPRTRGDGPEQAKQVTQLLDCSPHPRGWSRHPARGLPLAGLLPAPAGMVPLLVPRVRSGTAAPRTRGDGPASSSAWTTSSGLLPAPAGMVPHCTIAVPRKGTAPRTRGDGPGVNSRSMVLIPCSPHPRGWSRRPGADVPPPALLPAPAGMVLTAHVDVPGHAAAPRTRGDGPAQAVDRLAAETCSPHPRGWSRGAAVGRCARRLLPAPAGMLPSCGPSLSAGSPAPRTRGDGPKTRKVKGKGCSPHPQGMDASKRNRMIKCTDCPRLRETVPLLSDRDQAEPCSRERLLGPANRFMDSADPVPKTYPRGRSPINRE